MLLSVLALLLFLLAGASLLVWRMFQKRQVKGELTSCVLLSLLQGGWVLATVFHLQCSVPTIKHTLSGDTLKMSLGGGP